MAYCTHCGKENPDKAKFCTGCGTPLNVTAIHQKLPTEIPENIYPVKIGILQKNKAKWLIFGLLIFLALSTGVYVMFFNNKKDDALVTEKSVIIGKQAWMAKNLDVTSFRNGKAIPEAGTDAEWERAGKEGNPAWCYYKSNPANGTKNGKLYNWYAVSYPRGLAPKGWHIPNDEEWTILTNNLGGEFEAGTKMKNSSGWEDNGNGNNSSGFAGLPGGYRPGYSVGKSLTIFGAHSGWWSSSEFDVYSAWYRLVLNNENSVKRDNVGKAYGFSVRCLRD